MSDYAFPAEFPYALVAGYPGLPRKSTILASADNALCERGSFRLRGDAIPR